MPLLAPPPPDEVQVFYVLLDEQGEPMAAASAAARQALAARWLALLSPEERARHDGLRIDKVRREYLATRVLARTVLSRFAATEPDRWRFAAGPHGKPEIAAPGEVALSWNLSNTTGVVACAVAAAGDLGVDVEYLDRRSRTVEVAERFFAAPEVAALRALPPAAQRERFFEHWTLKEAYIKARGLGLLIPLRQFWFELSPPAPPRIGYLPEVDREPDRWWFAQFRPSPRHLAAVGLRRRSAAQPIELVLRQVTPLADEPQGW